MRARTIHLGLATAALLAGCGADPPAAAAGPRNVLLISLDTLRADACSLYGYERPTTPFLEELGARGVVFDQHVVNSNNTLTSHASMLTGLYMDVHQTVDLGDPERSRVLAPEYETLAERFREAGFETGSFTTHPTWLAEKFGLDQGFDVVESDWVDAPTMGAELVAWLEERRPRRFFAFVHFYDAHSESQAGEGALPYEAPPAYLARFAPPRPADFTGSVVDKHGEVVHTSRYLEHYASPFRDLPPGHLEFLRGCYDAGIAKLDDDLRDLFTRLDGLGVLADTLVVVTSDHGEEFKEHRRMLHMEYFDEIMRVPLLVVPPPSMGLAPRRVAPQTRCIDIAPTLLELAGVRPLTFAQGRSLAEAVRGTEELEHADSQFGPAIVRGRDEVSRFKFCNVPKYYSFFDLDTDPGEQDSLLARDLSEIRVDSERLNGIRNGLAAAKDENRLLVRAIGASGSEGVEMSVEELKRLEELGYFGSGD